MNHSELRKEIKSKMEVENCGLRRVEAESGVSFSTISRFLRGSTLVHDRHEKLENWINGKNTKKPNPVSCKRMKVGSKTFLVTIEELI